VAENSIRERLLSALEISVGNLSSVKTVIRRQPSDIEELKTYAATQLPLVSIVGSLPVPLEKRTTRLKGNIVDKFVSELRVENYFYFMNRVNPDTQISNILDDFWVLMYGDQTRSGLAISTDLEPKVEVVVWDPYVAFSVIAKIIYIHGTGGI